MIDKTLISSPEPASPFSSNPNSLSSRHRCSNSRTPLLPTPPLPHAAVDIAVACAVVAVAPHTDTLRCSLSLPHIAVAAITDFHRKILQRREQQVKLLIRACRSPALLPPHASFRRKIFQRREREQRARLDPSTDSGEGLPTCPIIVILCMCIIKYRTLMIIDNHDNIFKRRLIMKGGMNK